MKPVITPESNLVYKLPGGTEDNDLPCERLVVENAEGQKFSVIRSRWILDEEDIKRIQSTGGRVYITLDIYGEPIPPVALRCEEKGLVMGNGNGSPV